MCIASGESARKYDGSFQDDFSLDDGVDDLEKLDNTIWDDEQREIIRESVNGGHLQCYLFRCLHCETHLVWMDFD